MQPTLFETDEAPNKARSGSFVDNLRLPVHRWFRYSAGFSAEWAGQAIRSATSEKPIAVFDPFAGSGTVVLEAEAAGAIGIGVEAHPFVARVARAKLFWRADLKAIKHLAIKISKRAAREGGSVDGYTDLITKCFPRETLTKLDSLKRAWQQESDGSAASELCWLALVSILRAASPVGTAQWQYILPKKTKLRTVEPMGAFEKRISMLAGDMATRQSQTSGPPGKMLGADARTCEGIPDDWADLVLTSPPYANNYDYADATRLEMTFLGEISGWGDLQATVRTHLVRSCTQHVAPYAKNLVRVLADKVLQPIASELIEVCEKLGVEKEKHGGKKQYDAMIGHYFMDLARVWIALRKVTKRGGRVCFVVGDSAPYGVYVPVDRWLGELAVSAGFSSFRFEKLRDRNTKWKNRKHQVLLHEGRLWVEG